MPRQPRVDAPGALHHVWARGIERRTIFVDDADRHDLLERLCELLPASGMGCFAWAFMTNHVHLVVQTGHEPLSEVVRRLHGGYAIRFNRRHERHGYLFQNRYGSRVVNDTTDLLGLIRYVHRNPLEAGLVRDPVALETFPWCGYGALVGRRPALVFESVARVLELFEDDPDEARRRVRTLVSSAPGDPGDAGGGGRPQESLEALVGEVCARSGVSESELRSGRRTARVARAREEVCHRAAMDLGLTVRSIAAALGISPGAVSQAIARRRASRASTAVLERRRRVTKREAPSPY